MKRKIRIGVLVLLMVNMGFLSCSSDDSNDDGTAQPQEPQEPESTVLGDFWFGTFQEDAISNPEDPLPGFLYLNIPDNGTFEGELLFSYNGCVGGVDSGRASGTALNGTVEGTWQGTIDGLSFGGEYIGALSNDEQSIEGEYYNVEGKVEIECNAGFSYFVAPRGTWMLQRVDNNALNILVDTEANPLTVNWNGVTGAGVAYSAVFIDAECLEQEVDIVDCLMWIGLSNSESIVYGTSIGETVPVKDLVKGKTYLVSVSAANNSGAVLATSNLLFVY